MPRGFLILPENTDGKNCPPVDFPSVPCPGDEARVGGTRYVVERVIYDVQDVRTNGTHGCNVFVVLKHRPKPPPEEAGRKIEL